MVRKIDKSPDDYAPVISVGIGISSAALMFPAALQTFPGSGAPQVFKALAVSAISCLAITAFNMFANKFGAPRAAAGKHGMTALCVTGFTAISAVTGTLAFSGLTQPLSEKIALSSQCDALDQAVREISRRANHEAVLVAPLRSEAAGWGSAAELESKIGILTSKPTQALKKEIATTRQQQEPVAAFLRQQNERATSVANQVEGAVRRRGEAARHANGQVAMCRRLVSDEKKPIKSRRVEVGRIDAAVREALTTIEATSSKASVINLVRELSSPIAGVVVNEHLRDGQKLAIEGVKAAATRLDQAVAGLPSEEPYEIPAMPAEASVVSGWLYIGELWPFAIISYGLELIGGLAVWLFCVGYHRGRLEETADAAVVSRFPPRSPAE